MSQCVAVHCSVLQCVAECIAGCFIAVCCSKLQCAAVRSKLHLSTDARNVPLSSAICICNVQRVLCKSVTLVSADFPICVARICVTGIKDMRTTPLSSSKSSMRLLSDRYDASTNTARINPAQKKVGKMRRFSDRIGVKNNIARIDPVHVCVCVCVCACVCCVREREREREREQGREREGERERQREGEGEGQRERERERDATCRGHGQAERRQNLLHRTQCHAA